MKKIFMTFLILIALVLCSCSSFTRESKQSDLKPSSANTASRIQVTQTPIPSPTAAISIEPSIQATQNPTVSPASASSTKPETSKQPQNLNLSDPVSLLRCTINEFNYLLEQKNIKYKLEEDDNWTSISIVKGNVKNLYSFTTVDSSNTLRLVTVYEFYKSAKDEIIKKADSLYGKPDDKWKDKDANLNLEYHYDYYIDSLNYYYTLVFDDQDNSISVCYSTYSLDGSTPPSID